MLNFIFLFYFYFFILFFFFVAGRWIAILDDQQFDGEKEAVRDAASHLAVAINMAHMHICI